MAATVVFPESTQEALGQLAALEGAAPLAGGTWIMRAPLRGETMAHAYVSLARVQALREVEVAGGLRIGACVTHSALAAALADRPAFAGLRDAAGRSANPAVRQVATVGGALATAAFPASDIVTALLALDAEVELAGVRGQETVPLAGYLQARGGAFAGLVTAVVVPVPPGRSAHVRLTQRSGGDYPVAIVSVAVGAGGAVRVAIGSVEPVPRRWEALEAALAADVDEAAATAAALLDDTNPRDAVDAPGWYRAQVLPSLVRRAVAGLEGV